MLSFPTLHRILSLVIPLLPVRTRLRLWNYLHIRGRRLWKPIGQAQRIEGHMYLKSSTLVQPSEGLVTQFVRKNTNIPVPIVIDNFTIDGVAVLALSELPGENLLNVRHERGITAEQSRKLSKQIASLLGQLRALPPPSDAVSGLGNTPVQCERIAMDSPPAGPWSSISDFHASLVYRARITPPPEMADTVWEHIKLAHGRKHRICFTHNDFAPQNVLIDENFNVTGIIDWEASAWMPEYWEYTTSLFVPWYRQGWWFEIMSNAFPQYEVERQAEFDIWKYREIYS